MPLRRGPMHIMTRDRSPRAFLRSQRCFTRSDGGLVLPGQAVGQLRYDQFMLQPSYSDRGLEPIQSAVDGASRGGCFFGHFQRLR
jgi:hypothetical protein